MQLIDKVPKNIHFTCGTLNSRAMAVWIQLMKFCVVASLKKINNKVRN